MILKIIIGLIVGFTFGYTLQRTGVTKYPRVMGMLLLKDFKILKFMLVAVTCSMIAFYLLGKLGIITLYPKPLDIGKVVGGLIFGVGMGLLGYCPGTMAARIGEGKRDAWFGVMGMVAGILFYAVNIKFFKQYFLSKSISGDIGKFMGISPLIIIPIAAILFILIIYLVNKYFDDNKKIF